MLCNRNIKAKGLCHKHYNKAHSSLNPEKRNEYERSPNRRFKRHIATCKRSGIPFVLTFEEWKEIIKNNKCYYCPNTLPTNGIALDRKYPEIGYFLDNVVPCCAECNKTKRNRFSHIEFKIMMDALNDFRQRLQK